MKNKIILLLIIIFAGTHCPEFIGMSLQAQEQLTDTVWSKKIDRVNIVKFSPDGQYVFVGAYQNILKIDVKSGEILNNFNALSGTINNIAFSPTGDTIIFSGGLGGSGISLYNYSTLDTIYTIYPGSSTSGAYAFITPDGKRIITTTGKIGFDEPQILVIDIATKEIIKTFVGRYQLVHEIAISNNGEYFAINDLRGAKQFTFFIDLNTYEELYILDSSGLSGINDIDISGDNKIAYNADELIYIWDVEKRKLLHSFSLTNPEPYEIITNVLFSKNSKYIIYGNRTETEQYRNCTYVYDIQKDSIVYKYPFPSNSFGGLDISKDDYIITYSRGGYLYLLRPKWNGTDVKEPKHDDFKYSYNNKKLKIEFNDNLINESKIQVYNILGVVGRNAVPLQQGNTIEIDLENLSSGIYFVQVLVNAKTYFLKINNY